MLSQWLNVNYFWFSGGFSHLKALWYMFLIAVSYFSPRWDSWFVFDYYNLLTAFLVQHPQMLPNCIMLCPKVCALKHKHTWQWERLQPIRKQNISYISQVYLKSVMGLCFEDNCSCIVENIFIFFHNFTLFLYLCPFHFDQKINRKNKHGIFIK